jgi:PPOX class probable F420-dependent enzyme
MSSQPTAGDSRVPVAERLARDAILWLGTTRPDGRPHVIPIWFAWDGAAISMYSKPHAQKVRNLEHNPSAMVALGEPEEEMDVELIEGRAAVLASPTAELIAPAFFEKYAALMSASGLTPEVYVQTYSKAVEIRPTRLIGWGGPGWEGAKQPGRNDDDVAGHLWRPGADELHGAIRRAMAAPSRDPALLALEE